MLLSQPTTPLHHQLCQGIVICLILPVNCVQFPWHVLDTCLPGTWQSLEKHYQVSNCQASAKLMSTAWHLLDHYLSDALCFLQVIVKHLASQYNAHAKRVAHNWKHHKADDPRLTELVVLGPSWKLALSPNLPLHYLFRTGQPHSQDPSTQPQTVCPFWKK